MNSDKVFKTERVLHELVIASIEDNSFASIIKDEAGMLDFSVFESSDVFPQFSLDHITRRSLMAAGKAVMKSFSIMDVLSSDKNISTAKKEVLKPDIICVNPEIEQIILIEIKNESQTGREALTELLAYEQELKNTLPMISNYDVCCVIISPEWSTLMDHSVASAVAWSGHNVLMLTADMDDTGLVLKTRIPTAWNITGNVYFPDEAFPSVTVCLYEKTSQAPEATDGAADEIDNRLLTAVDVMAREGDRLGGHGFLLLWKDYSSVSLTRFNLTVCGVSPVEFYKAMRSRNKGALNGHLSPALDSYIAANDPRGHAESLMKVATAAYPILKELSSPMLEGFHHWDVDRELLKRRAVPIRTEFWGVLGSYSRDYVLNPAVREHRRSTLLNGSGDWRDPQVGIPLIQAFTRPEIFVDGDVRCGDAFRLGVILGLDRSLRSAIKDQEEVRDAWKCRYLWNRYDHMSAIDEMRLLANAATNVKAPTSPLRFHEDPYAEDTEDFQKLYDWICEEFFQKSTLHLLCFHVGLNGAVVFDEKKRGYDAAPIPEEYFDPIKKEMLFFCKSLVAMFKSIEKESGLWGELPSRFSSLTTALGLKRKFKLKDIESISFEKVFQSWALCLELSEHVVEPVFHRHADVALTDIDWVWMQQGVREMRAEGKQDAGVMLLPNGSLVTGQVNPYGMKINMHIDDPELQVLFMDRSSGIGVMRVVTWEELKSGAAFRYRSKGTNG